MIANKLIENIDTELWNKTFSCVNTFGLSPKVIEMLCFEIYCEKINLNLGREMKIINF